MRIGIPEGFKLHLPEGLKLDLVTRFSVATLFPIIAIGVVITIFLNDLIDDRAVDEAERSARLVAEVGVADLLEDVDLSKTLSPEVRTTLGEELRDGRVAEVRVSGLLIWNTQKTLLFTTKARPTIPSQGEIIAIESALRGDARSARGENYQLTVFTALHTEGPEPTGVVEVTIPYSNLVEDARSDLWSLYLVLLGGLLILFGSLYRLFASASKTLERRAAEKEHQALHDVLTGLANRGCSGTGCTKLYGWPGENGTEWRS